MTLFLLGVLCGGLAAVALAVIDDAMRRQAKRRREKARLAFLEGRGPADHWYERL